MTETRKEQDAAAERAKGSSAEIARETVAATPYLQGIQASVQKALASQGGGGNPMLKMMANAMEPMFSQLVGGLVAAMMKTMPGAAAAAPQAGQPAQPGPPKGIRIIAHQTRIRRGSISVTIKQAINEFLLSCKVEGKSYGTIECY